MERTELALARLSNQYLLHTGERMEVLRAMNGFQAQFLSNALYAMRLRSTAYDTAHAADSLVKSWTLRGTMHIFAEADLPLFLHTGCRYRSRDWTVPSFWNQRPNWALTPKRQAYFSDLIIDALAQGPMTREALKARCRAAGMTQAEEGSIFHPWGGGIRELCERGFLCGTVSEEKAFRLCPAFTPMEEQDALLEQTRRYFTNYGPASIRDAAYYFGSSQAEIKSGWPGFLWKQPNARDSGFSACIPAECRSRRFQTAYCWQASTRWCWVMRKSRVYFFRRSICAAFSVCPASSCRRCCCTAA